MAREKSSSWVLRRFDRKTWCSWSQALQIFQPPPAGHARAAAHLLEQHLQWNRRESISWYEHEGVLK